MSNKTHSQPETYQIHPIGYVRRNGAGIQLEISRPFRPALKELEHFSHVMVFWRRRLSESAHDLAHTDKKIIEIACDYQFNNPETFSRVPADV